MARLSGRLTYANVMATVAVFVALGGSGYAAVTLSKNSVGSKQIRNRSVKTADLADNAVTSAKVKDGSLLSADFKPGQLVAGAPGATGPQGVKGDKGDPGTNGTDGATGPRGPSDAYAKTTTFGLSNLPAGSYQIIGKLGITGVTGAASIDCTLTATPSGGGTLVSLDHAASGGTGNVFVSLQALRTFSVPQDLFLSCSGSGTGATFSDPQLSAIQVATIH